MQSSLMRNFKRAAAATGLVMLAAGASFNAGAHVLPGSVLEKSKGFVNAMTRINPDGSTGTSCCHQKDGQGGLTEEPIYGADGITVTGYIVTIVNDEMGNPLEAPVKREIPQEAILRYPDAVAFCKKLKETDPTSEDAATCKVPTTNVLWTSSIPHAPNANLKDQSSFRIYCYLPKPPKF